MDMSAVQVTITSIEPGATIEAVYWSPNRPPGGPFTVTMIVALDYLKKYGIVGVSYGGRQLTLTEQKVVLVVDELKLQLTFEDQEAP